MNPLLQKKLEELNAASEYECWYLVKQPTEFPKICYLTSFLKAYKETDKTDNLETFINNCYNKNIETKPKDSLSNNYRALRVAAFFGLIKMTSSRYDEAVITDTFEEITERCNGDYENSDLYDDIIQRQIEKMFVSTSIDEEYRGVRKDYRLYPVIFLYKVLLELGRSTGNYRVSMTEYRYLVATTKKYEDFLDTLLLIKLMRDDSSAPSAFEQYRTKFDNRLIQALKQLNTLSIDKDFITLNAGSINDCAIKVFKFENNIDSFDNDNYISFLCSSRTLLSLVESDDDSKEDDEKGKDNGEECGENILLYGVPGAGKSHEIDSMIVKDRSIRVVFHPDYSYSDFVGQILPRLTKNDEGKEVLEYVFEEGPFTKILHMAHDDRDNMYYLVIEELNRGNAPAIFGDIFQLLDREDDGSSKYEITNYDIAKKVFGEGHEKEKIKIPSNLTILATMNTSDQNVFTLDTAFQRRWDMRLIKNDISAAKHADVKIERSDVCWGDFAIEVNNRILEVNESVGSFGDKRLGAYFAKRNELGVDRFAGKVLKYLWDDAFKMNHDMIFIDSINSLELLIETFKNAPNDPLAAILRPEIYKKMKPANTTDNNGYEKNEDDENIDNEGSDTEQ